MIIEKFDFINEKNYKNLYLLMLKYQKSKNSVILLLVNN